MEKKSFVSRLLALSILVAGLASLASSLWQERSAEIDPPAEAPQKIIPVAAGPEHLQPPMVSARGQLPPRRLDLAEAPAEIFTLAPPPSAPMPAQDGAEGCTPALTLAAEAGAQLRLSLVAPCHQGARVVIQHAGLTFAERIGANGRLSLHIPALAASGEVALRLADGTQLSAATVVPDLSQIQRFALQWVAGDAFQLQPSTAAQQESFTQTGQAPLSRVPRGAVLQRLGTDTLDTPLQAMVYTWPEASAAPITLGIEAEVTEATCGREMLGETLELRDNRLTVAELTLSMPSCDALGDILVLNNVASDKTVTAMN